VRGRVGGGGRRGVATTRANDSIRPRGGCSSSSRRLSGRVTVQAEGPVGPTEEFGIFALRTLEELPHAQRRRFPGKQRRHLRSGHPPTHAAQIALTPALVLLRDFHGKDGGARPFGLVVEEADDGREDTVDTSLFQHLATRRLVLRLAPFNASARQRKYAGMPRAMKQQNLHGLAFSSNGDDSRPLPPLTAHVAEGHSAELPE